MSKKGFALGLLLITFVNSVFAVEVMEEIVERTYVLDPGASLSISNIDGSVRIYGGDQPELRLQAIKKAYSAERLQAIDVDVRVEGKSVRIETRIPGQRKWGIGDRSGTVEYTLIVPQGTRITSLDLINGEVLVEGLRGGGVKARLVNGWLGGHNCFADLDLAITNGHLDLTFDWWEGDTFSATAASVNGSIRAIIPPDGPFDLTAETTTGRVDNGLVAGKNDREGLVRSVAMSLGREPGSQVNLKTTHGNIKLEKAY